MLDAAEEEGAWIRAYNDHSKVGLSSRNNTDSKTDNNIRGLQVGADLNFVLSQGSRWVIGVTGQYGSLNSKIRIPNGSGSVDTVGLGLGAAATWYSEEGSYVDVQGQVNSLDSDFSSSASGPVVSGESSSTAYALSVEAGHHFAVSQYGGVIPQAQLSWGFINGGRFTDTAGNVVDLKNNDSLIGRVGVAYEFSKDDKQRIYAIGNFLHDFSDATNVEVATVNRGSELDFSNWAEVGFGGAMVFGNMQVYGETSYRTALGGGSGNNGFSGSVGLRVEW